MDSTCPSGDCFFPALAVLLVLLCPLRRFAFAATNPLFGPQGGRTRVEFCQRGTGLFWRVFARRAGSWTRWAPYFATCRGRALLFARQATGCTLCTSFFEPLTFEKFVRRPVVTMFRHPPLGLVPPPPPRPPERDRGGRAPEAGAAHQGARSAAFLGPAPGAGVAMAPGAMPYGGGGFPVFGPGGQVPHMGPPGHPPPRGLFGPHGPAADAKLRTQALRAQASAAKAAEKAASLAAQAGLQAPHPGLGIDAQAAGVQGAGQGLFGGGAGLAALDQALGGAGNWLPGHPGLRPEQRRLPPPAPPGTPMGDSQGTPYSPHDGGALPPPGFYGLPGGGAGGQGPLGGGGQGPPGGGAPNDGAGYGAPFGGAPNPNLLIGYP